MVTHGVLPGDALDRLRGSGVLEKLVVTDSHPRAAALRDDFVEVVSVAEVFAQALSG